MPVSLSVEELVEAAKRLTPEERKRLVRALIKPLDEGKYEIAELRGLGKEIWHDQDAQEYLGRERDAWER